MSETKPCKACGIDKPETAYDSPGMRDGKPRPRRSTCRECREHRSEDESILALAREGGMETFGAEPSFVAALLRLGNVNAAAYELGVTPRAFRASFEGVRHAAARKGVSPAEDNAAIAPIGFHVRGKSIMYRTNEDGSKTPVLEWFKTASDSENKLAAILDAYRRVQPTLPIAPLINRELFDAGHCNDKLLTLLPMGDPHLGLLAWSGDSGNTFDLKIAERNLYNACDRLVAGCPDAGTGLLLSLGDFYNADNMAGMTSHGTKQDNDSRQTKVLDVGIELMHRMINRMRQKFARTHVICEIGNHDEYTSMMLALCLKYSYKDCPEVTIDTNAAPYHWYRFGKVLLGSHHGDRCKPSGLLGVMANDRAVDWGETAYRHMHIGHVHHDTLEEFSGMTVESHATLAGRSAWEFGKGYRAGRRMKAITYHADFGEIERQTVNLSMLGAS